MKEKYEKQLSESKDFFDSLPWEEKEFYADFLAQTYYFVCHSTRMLCRSMSHFGVDRDLLYRRFAAHLSEEAYHERIAESDLKFLKTKVQDFPERSITRSFWQNQFYRIDNSGGTSILGYILYLEAIAVHCFDDIAARLEGNYGAKGSKFIKVHTEEDPEHLTHAIDLIEGLSEAEKNNIWENFFDTANIYEAMLRGIAESCEKSVSYKRSA